MSAPLSFQSRVVVVTQPASCATGFKLTVALLPSGLRPVALASFAICEPSAFAFVGVGQPAIAASADNAPPAWFGPPFFPSVARGVFQPFSDEPEPLSDVRRADARSAQICRPNGVARCFHVSAYSVEPPEAVLARNLLSKDDWRAALCDEPMEDGPEVALVFEALALASGTEWLAGT